MQFLLWNDFHLCPVWFWAHPWRSGSALKAGRREVPGAIPGRVCGLSRSEFSLFFSEIRVNTPAEVLPHSSRTLE